MNTARMEEDNTEVVTEDVVEEELELEPLWDGFQYFQHQVDGIRWMLERETKGVEVSYKKKGVVTVRGGLQCDEMGLGKTIQVVGTMVNNLVPVTVLLAPLAMVETWTGVCQRAGFRVFQAAGSQWHFLDSKQNRRSESIYITNFEKLYTTPRLFRALAVDRVVMDEAHKIRNPDGQMAIYARRLSARLRWAVTGTPLVNEWRDVVSLLAFLGVPCSPLWRWEDHLTEVLPHLILHRSLEELRTVLSDAPPYPLVEHMKLPFLTEEEREFYLGVQSAEMASPEDHLTSQEAFLLILRLRQISVHPQVYIQAKRREKRTYPRPDWEGPSTKLVALREILMRDEWIKPEAIESEEAPHKYIIFCQFKEEMELIHEYLDSLNLFSPPNILEYDGSLTQEQRERVLTHSKKATEPTALLLQLQAGGVGLNLQECDRIIFISPWWTSALMDQAIARAVRMGQKRVVRVYHLELEVEEAEENTIFIDHMIDQKAEEKRGMLRDLFVLCDALKAQLEAVSEAVEEEAASEAVEEETVTEEEETVVEPGQA